MRVLGLTRQRLLTSFGTFFVAAGSAARAQPTAGGVRTER